MSNIGPACTIPRSTRIQTNFGRNGSYAMASSIQMFAIRSRSFLVSDEGASFVPRHQRSPFRTGFGSRICPGRYFADAALFINIASVLHVFDIGPPLDEKGNPIYVKMEMSDGFLSCVPPRLLAGTPWVPYASRPIDATGTL